METEQTRWGKFSLHAAKLLRVGAAGHRTERDLRSSQSLPVV